MAALSPGELKAQLNKLARQIYERMGYQRPDGFDFSAAYHPQEHLCYVLAIDALRFFQLEGLPKLSARKKLDLMLGCEDPLLVELASPRERLKQAM